MNQKANENVERDTQFTLKPQKPIRPYICSTLNDFQEERNFLATNIFPQLNELCHSRGTYFKAMDLRWSVLKAQKSLPANLFRQCCCLLSQQLKLCLDYVNSCFPFFICMLGQTYGDFLPDHSPFMFSKATDLSSLSKAEQNLYVAAKNGYPWVLETPNCSLTEFEIIQAAFRKQSQFQYFYFRTRTMLLKILSGEKEESQSSGALVNEEEKLKIGRLKAKIISKGLPVRFYKDLHELGELVFKDWSAVIEKLNPVTLMVKNIDYRHSSERFYHEEFIEKCKQVFVSSKESNRTFEILERFALKDVELDLKNAAPDSHLDSVLRINPLPASKSILLLSGERGCGKSTLLANFVNHFRNKYPSVLIIPHFVGSTCESSDVMSVLHYFITELQHRKHRLDGWVTDALCLLCVSHCGLTEDELLQLLDILGYRNHYKVTTVHWAAFRNATKQWVQEKPNGVLYFRHQSLRSTVEHKLLVLECKLSKVTATDKCRLIFCIGSFLKLMGKIKEAKELFLSIEDMLMQNQSTREMLLKTQNATGELCLEIGNTQEGFKYFQKAWSNLLCFPFSDLKDSQNLMKQKVRVLNNLAKSASEEYLKENHFLEYATEVSKLVNNDPHDQATMKYTEGVLILLKEIEQMRSRRCWPQGMIQQHPERSKNGSPLWEHLLKLDYHSAQSSNTVSSAMRMNADKLQRTKSLELVPHQISVKSKYALRKKISGHIICISAEKKTQEKAQNNVEIWNAPRKEASEKKKDHSFKVLSMGQKSGLVKLSKQRILSDQSASGEGQFTTIYHHPLLGPFNTNESWHSISELISEKWLFHSPDYSWTPPKSILKRRSQIETKLLKTSINKE
ncbi:Tetratricopeptide repeat protein 41 [Sciurus carolinensis]|uniref:Tetratricopeptide repeat protein 41 n=1 Tax=Sciurus carolinensis TaxID=30640 RepID=A0AA41N939_SCICA|nr:Tetratricopeptide repeat protein 41 [Sciurus carolinensis]